MNEHEWTACPDVNQMLLSLQEPVNGRKLRLFACACCRLIWDSPFMTDSYRKAIATAERYTDGLIAEREWNTLYDSLADDNPPEYLTAEHECPYRAVFAALTPYSSSAFRRTITFGSFDARRVAARTYFRSSRNQEATERDLAVEARRQAHLLRDLHGPTLFRHVPIDADWLSWRDGMIARMAQVIYDESRFADMPVLADALEEAGCVDAEILSHCRQTRAHVRGCWVVDLLLGKV